jgi:hypothetical protein
MEREDGQVPHPVPGGVCVSPDGFLGTGDPCGQDFTDETCVSDLCVSVEPSAPGYCATPCSTQSDCPDFVAWGNGIYETVCTLKPGLTMGTPNPTDDPLIGLCALVPAQSSLKNCSDEPCPVQEMCVPVLQPGPSPEVTHFCMMPQPGAAMPGEGCDPWANTVTCATGLCLPGQFPYTGICSTTCTTDLECQNLDPALRCLKRSVFPAIPKIQLAVCSPPPLCSLCRDDLDCMDGYVCVDVSMGSWPRDYRCMPACDKDQDCQQYSPTSLCQSLNAPPNNTGGASHKVCPGITCP